jgi:hypothetical protein
MKLEHITSLVEYTNKFTGILQTIGFYIVAFVAILVLNVLSPSGPCTPGLGILVFILLLITGVVLLIKNIFHFLTRQASNGIVILLHFSVLVVLFALVSFNIL